MIPKELAWLNLKDLITNDNDYEYIVESLNNNSIYNPSGKEMIKDSHFELLKKELENNN